MVATELRTALIELCRLQVWSMTMNCWSLPSVICLCSIWKLGSNASSVNWKPTIRSHVPMMVAPIRAADSGLVRWATMQNKKQVRSIAITKASCDFCFRKSLFPIRSVFRQIEAPLTSLIATSKLFGKLNSITKGGQSENRLTSST